MKNKLIEKVYDFWIRYDETYRKKVDKVCLRKQIEDFISSDNKDKLGNLLDWCQDEYAYIENGLHKEMKSELDYVWELLQAYNDYLDTKDNKWLEWLEYLLERGY